MPTEPAFLVLHDETICTSPEELKAAGGDLQAAIKACLTVSEENREAFTREVAEVYGEDAAAVGEVVLNLEKTGTFDWTRIEFPDHKLVLIAGQRVTKFLNTRDNLVLSQS